MFFGGPCSVVWEEAAVALVVAVSEEEAVASAVSAAVVLEAEAPADVGNNAYTL